ncbi:MAG: hypothetical protein H6703_00605 [Myxococcales bacterium]|nr:hypothetical protein [Myxococcales bacterium]
MFEPGDPALHEAAVAALAGEAFEAAERVVGALRGGAGGLDVGVGGGERVAEAIEVHVADLDELPGPDPGVGEALGLAAQRFDHAAPARGLSGVLHRHSARGRSAIYRNAGARVYPSRGGRRRFSVGRGGVGCRRGMAWRDGIVGGVIAGGVVLGVRSG